VVKLQNITALNKVDGNDALFEAFFEISIIFELYTKYQKFFKNVAVKTVEFLGL